MTHRTLPANASVRNLKVQAKTLLRDVKSGEPAAYDRVRNAVPTIRQSHDGSIHEVPFSLKDAQRVVAIEYGFESWRHLRAAVDDAKPPESSAVVEFLTRLRQRDVRGIKAFLATSGAHAEALANVMFDSNLVKLEGDAFAAAARRGVDEPGRAIAPLHLMSMSQYANFRPATT